MKLKTFKSTGSAMVLKINSYTTQEGVDRHRADCQRDMGKTISQACLTPTEAKRDAFPSALPEDWGTGAMFQAPSIYSGTEAEESHRRL